MDEEEISNNNYFHSGPCLEDMLIKKYYFGIEERIHYAGSKKEAKGIIEEACDGFDQECIGDITPFYLRRIVENMYEKYWCFTRNNENDYRSAGNLK